LRVSEVMTAGVLSCPLQTSLAEVVEQLTARRFGAVVVTRCRRRAARSAVEIRSGSGLQARTRHKPPCNGGHADPGAQLWPRRPAHHRAPADAPQGRAAPLCSPGSTAPHGRRAFSLRFSPFPLGFLPGLHLRPPDCRRVELAAAVPWTFDFFAEAPVLHLPRRMDMISRPHRNLPVLLLFLLVCFLVGATRAQTARDVRIGLLAKRGSEIDVKLWTATADYLTARLPAIVSTSFRSISPRSTMPSGRRRSISSSPIPLSTWNWKNCTG